MWTNQDPLRQTTDTGERGCVRSCIYPDAVTQMLQGLKQVFQLPPHALQCFAGSLRRLTYPELPSPNFLTLNRRTQDLEIVLPVPHTGEPPHLVIDSSSQNSQQCHEAVCRRGAQSSIPAREGVMPWPETTHGACTAQRRHR
ncbi:hypothetical protein LMG9673_04794 [Ralstonia pseudosolanacearum]|nr:hypothetical protein LMG9673_04794 [Ralstonia pseudosolanacearum]